MPGYLESWCDHLGHKSFFNLEKEHSRVVKKFKTIWRKAVRSFVSFQSQLCNLTMKSEYILNSSMSI